MKVLVNNRKSKQTSPQSKPIYTSCACIEAAGAIFASIRKSHC